MFLRLFTLKIQVPIPKDVPTTVTAPPATVAPPLPEVQGIKVLSTSEVKDRRTGKPTIFVYFAGGKAPYKVSVLRDGQKLQTILVDQAGMAAVEHSLTEGMYSIEVQDANTLKASKPVQVQPSDADLTITQAALSGNEVTLALDAGRANLGPYRVSIFSEYGVWQNSVAATGTNPISANLGVPAGSYYVQVMERNGYWSNMVPITIVGGTSTTVGESTDDFFLSDLIFPGENLNLGSDFSESTIKPRLAQYGRLSDLNPIFSGSPGAWKVSDASTLSLPDGYSWAYYVGTDRIITRSPLKDYPIEHNNPYKIVKMKLRNGVDSFEKWDIQGKAPGEDGYSAWNDRTAGDFFAKGDIGSCVSVIVL